LSIFKKVIQNAVGKVVGDPSCPADKGHVIATCDTAKNCNKQHWALYYVERIGVPLTDLIQKVKKRQIAVNQTIYELESQAKVLVSEPIIDMSNVTVFAQQFIGITNMIESGITTAECRTSAPISGCGHRSHHHHHPEEFECWNCNKTYPNFPCQNMAPGAITSITYLKGLAE